MLGSPRQLFTIFWERENHPIDNFFQNTSSPFVERIITYLLPDKFKPPDVLAYSGLGDPVEHLENFQARLDLLGTPYEVICKAFPLTLAGIAREWFRKLLLASFISFESLGRMFLSQFMAGIVRGKPAESLMTIKQGSQESLQSYLKRFNLERLAAESHTDELAHCVVYQGIRKDGTLMADLARKPSHNLQEFLDRAEEFVNQEETMRAFREIEGVKTDKEDNKKRLKKKESRYVKNVAERRAPKRIEEYNWTPLNATPAKVLMEIKKDPEYKKPPPILGNPPPYNAHKYCSFHNSYGHWTDSCVVLRELIEKFKINGKLARFLVNSREDWRGIGSRRQRPQRKESTRRDAPIIKRRTDLEPVAGRDLETTPGQLGWESTQKFTLYP